MGLFGLLCTFITGGTYVAGKIKDARYDSERRHTAEINNDITYHDAQGNTRLTSTSSRVYSDGRIVKDTKGNIVARPYIAYYNNLNEQSIATAKQNNYKYARIYHFRKISDPNSVFHCDTELSTMNPYFLSFDYFGGDDWIYHMHYSTRDDFGSFIPTKLKRLTREEFVEYGGLIPYISIEEYCKGKSADAKYFYKKIHETYRKDPWEE